LDGEGNCGSGTFTWELRDEPGDVQGTFNKQTTAWEERIQLTIEADEDANLNLTEDATVRASPVGGSSPPLTVPFPIHVMCSLDLETCPILEIQDREQGDAVVSGSALAQNTVIGKRMRVKVRLKPGTHEGYVMKAQGWQLTGGSGDFAIDGYNFIDGDVIPLNPAEGDDEQIDFHYVIPGDGYIVRAGAQLGHEGGSDLIVVTSATYNAKGPTNISMIGVPTTQGVTLGPHKDAGAKALRFGRGVGPDSLGIAFTFTADPPPGGGGDWTVTQLFEGGYARTPPDTILVGAPGEYWLDVCPRYFNRSFSTNEAATANDSPAVGLNSTYSAYGMDIDFKTYFMYKPNAVGSIWVPIGLLEWEIEGVAVKDTNLPFGWALHVPSAPQDTVLGAATAEFPEWDHSYNPFPIECIP
jgi:hypothetical protein